jgi:BirA family transcriptional regulator, biotin operon repressor / biotin---[acetyl-CoA-carboxylase] ligase
MPAGNTPPPDQYKAKTADPRPPYDQLGQPHIHLRRTDSTNERARRLAIAGAPHGTLVTADEQTAGRGRQGRSWLAPPRSALLCSLVLRWEASDRPPPLFSLAAGVAVCDAIEDPAPGHVKAWRGGRVRLKWPNDVVLERTSGAGEDRPSLAKLAGILVEGRPQEGWSVLGIGLNVAVRVEDLPAELRARAASLELDADAIEPVLQRLLRALQKRLSEETAAMLEGWRERDALIGREVAWAGGRGLARGIGDAGGLVVSLADGGTVTLEAGEVHLSV